MYIYTAVDSGTGDMNDLGLYADMILWHVQ